MIHRRSMHITFMLTMIIGLGIGNQSHAADYFFVFGGGYSPQGNQISLERNVLYFQRLLQSMGTSDRHQHYLFADGEGPDRDLQFRQYERTKFHDQYLLAEILNPNDDLYNGYRSSVIPSVAGSCSIANVDYYFDHAAHQLTNADRLLIYFTGHGGNGEKADPQNTRLHLWNRQDIKMKEFTARLDKVPAGTPTVLVMVQCYSGGFANVIFNDGDPAKGLSPENRVGFFATVFDRQAAGCTADIDEANYEEYSSWFWAAMSGTKRLGEHIDKPDYDSDGKTCFSEAHAYALLHSDSIDISVKTSDALLRHYSTLDVNFQKDGAVVPGLLSADSDYTELAALANPYEKAVMEGLSTQLQFFGSQRTKYARDTANAVEQQRNALKEERKRLIGELNGVRGEIGNTVKAHWPELANAWHPLASQIVASDARSITETIEKHPRFDRYTQIIKRLGEIDDQSLSLERKWAKCQRFIRAMENVALQANLPKIAAPEVNAKYTQMIQAECGTLP